MADWVAIRAEYVTTQISTRALAQKVGVAYSTLRRRCEDEGWAQLRSEHERNTHAMIAQKTAEAISDHQADRIAMLVKGGEKSVEMLIKRLEQMADSDRIKVAEIKVITDALKNVRDIYKTEVGTDDAKYQKARELLGGVPDALDG